MSTPAPAAPPAPAGAGGAAAAPGEWIIDVTTTTFRDVVMGSKVPVILDFWADWCGPCRELGPRLEAAVKAQGGAVILAKVNTDQEPQLAQAMQVRSLPTVVGIVGGKMAASFQGAVPDTEVASFMKQLLEAGGGQVAPSGPAAQLRQLVEAADAAMLQGQRTEASALLEQAVELGAAAAAEAPSGKVPEDVQGARAEAVAAQLRLALVQGDEEASKAAVATLRSAEFMKFVSAPRIAASLAQAALTALVAEDAQAQSMSMEEAAAAVQADPKNAAKHLLACRVAAAQGLLDTSIDAGLLAVRLDKGDVRAAARKLLVSIFDALGPAQPLAVEGRKRLSQVLFM